MKAGPDIHILTAVIHALSTTIPSLFTVILLFDRTATTEFFVGLRFKGKGIVDKIKRIKFGSEVVKSVILCQLVTN